MDLNEFAQEVHANAVNHGWWDKEYTDAAAIALIHAEISEALEEWRANRPMVYYKCRLDSICNGECKRDAANCVCRDTKPEGIAVELIDVVLRILDTAAAWGIKLSNEFWVEPDPAEPELDLHKQNIDQIANYALPELACELHRLAEELRFQRDLNGKPNHMGTLMSIMIGMIYIWLHAQNIDPKPIMLEKHEYNKTRPYKHGGKKI